MPINDFECIVCEANVKDVLHHGGSFACERCGAEMKKRIGLPAIHWAPGVSPAHDGDRSAHQKFMELPETKAKLADGRYAIQKATDNRDGAEWSSDTQTRIQAIGRLS